MCLLFDIRDHSRALRLARSSAAGGSAYGQYAMGWAHQYGSGGAAEDYDEAYRWHVMAAEQGLADAQYVAWGGGRECCDDA